MALMATRKMKALLTIASLAVAMLTACSGGQQPAGTPSDSWKALEKPLNFYIANDLGRNGYYEQKTVAGTMGEMAGTIDVEFVLAAGDVHHFEGVRSTSDPLWMTNYELIYSHPDLMIPWYPVCGNHEYRGSTDAVVAYSDISARWRMPAKYYSFTAEEDGTTIRIVMLDTPPLLDKYRNDSEKYPDAAQADMEAELEWLDSTLAEADEDWVLVVGHHPIYAYTDKDEGERTDMQQRVNSILLKHDNVDMYICGHIHNFQHIRMPGCDIDYVVNSSGSLSRDVEEIEGTVFCSSEEGYSLVCVSGDELDLHMLDAHGNVLHTVRRLRQPA